MRNLVEFNLDYRFERLWVGVAIACSPQNSVEILSEKAVWKIHCGRAGGGADRAGTCYLHKVWISHSTVTDRLVRVIDFDQAYAAGAVFPGHDGGESPRRKRLEYARLVRVLKRKAIGDECRRGCRIILPVVV